MVVMGMLAPSVSTQSPKSQDAHETVASIQAAYKKAQNDWLQAYRKAKPEERTKLKRPDVAVWRKKMWGICEGRLDAGESAEALLWIASFGARGEEMERALDALAKHHLQHAGIAKLAGRLNRNMDAASEHFLRLVIERTKSDDARGYARYALGKSLARRASLARRLASDESLPKEYTKYYGASTVEYVMHSKPAKLEKEAEELLATCVKAHAKLVLYGRPLGELSAGDLFELRNLTVGKMAPDIKGEDIDGVEFHLSDYKGKVLMLDFWGDW